MEGMVKRIWIDPYRYAISADNHPIIGIECGFDLLAPYRNDRNDDIHGL